jgi:formylglycine-generating enzyme required for sulfatase activity
MVWVDGGAFMMGSDRYYREETPAHPVAVDGFWIDPYPVTNAEFRIFVAETGYVTGAERPPDPAEYPEADPALLVPASAVFTRPAPPVNLGNPYQWWSYIAGADWRHPRGPGSSLRGIEDHPVVHLTWADVAAFALWAGKDLPTEAEWEYAALGGAATDYPWGTELAPEGRHLANTWQGEFPTENLRLDGYERTSPVNAFPPNNFGLFDMIGNVWEWTADWYGHHPLAPPDEAGPMTLVNPRGGDQRRSVDPVMPPIPRKAIKGGSYLCAPNFCRRFRPAARMPQPVDTSSCHLGFRCVVRPPL